MIGAEVKGGVEVECPFGSRLSWDGVDEIDRDSFDAGVASEIDGERDGLGAMKTFEGFEEVWAKGLDAEAEPIDASGAKDVHELWRCGFRVALDGELAFWMERKEGVDSGEERLEKLGFEEGGGAAADEDGFERACEWCDGVEFEFETVEECVLTVLAIDDGVEIAVVAFVGAEGDVKVQ
jgi:hypothetical protein